jgi:hypothetical protein
MSIGERAIMMTWYWLLHLLAGKQRGSLGNHVL